MGPAIDGKLPGMARPQCGTGTVVRCFTAVYTLSSLSGITMYGPGKFGTDFPKVLENDSVVAPHLPRGGTVVIVLPDARCAGDARRRRNALIGPPLVSLASSDSPHRACVGSALQLGL